MFKRILLAISFTFPLIWGVPVLAQQEQLQESDIKAALAKIDGPDPIQRVLDTQAALQSTDPLLRSLALETALQSQDGRVQEAALIYLTSVQKQLGLSQIWAL